MALCNIHVTGSNSDFSFSYTGCHIKVKEPSLPYYLPIIGGRIVRSIPFPRLLALCEMQTASSRFELGSVCPFLSMINITQRMPPSRVDCLDLYISCSLLNSFFLTEKKKFLVS